MKFFKLTKKNWMSIHTYLSLFFLPTALLYVITGAGLIFDIETLADATIKEYNLTDTPKKGEERAFMLQKMEEYNIAAPRNTKVQIFRGNPTMGSFAYSVTLLKKPDGSLSLRSTKLGIYGLMTLMHLSVRGSFWFDVIAIGFCVSMVLFYLSGLIVTSFCRNRRKLALWTFLAGLFAVIIATIIGAF